MLKTSFYKQITFVDPESYVRCLQKSNLFKLNRKNPPWTSSKANVLKVQRRVRGKEKDNNGGERVSYYFSKLMETSFEEAITRVTEGLKKEGFGILTDIDVKETLKKKLDVDFRRYKILGACNPPSAYRALKVEDKVGSMLPCNVVVQETPQGEIEVAAVDPLASMKAIENDDLKEVAEQIQGKLKKVIDSLL
jgi:uncharacterized protein (DUF302 family)